MFFLLRCAFWLTIVFHAMTWPSTIWTQTPATQDGSVQRGVLRLASDAAGTMASAAGAAITAKLEESCVKAPAECLALASRLPQIVATTRAVEIGVPKWPLRLAESEPVWSGAGHKLLSQHN